MLSAPIDHNREPEPEKHVSKIRSPYWVLPANGGLGTAKDSRPPHVSEGIILRVRDTRLMERRKMPASTEHVERERRTRDTRKSNSPWDTTHHHILVIALERKAGEPELWKAGDRVSLVPKNQVNAPPPPDIKTSKPPLLIKDEGDYVLHLSTHYPYER